MWISKKYYKELLEFKNERDKFKSELSYSLKRASRLNEQLNRYEKGDIAVITGKYFFAEKTCVKGVWLWAIYRKDLVIEPEKSALVFECLTVENAERLVSYFDETIEEMLEQKGEKKNADDENSQHQSQE